MIDFLVSPGPTWIIFLSIWFGLTVGIAITLKALNKTIDFIEKHCDVDIKSIEK